MEEKQILLVVILVLYQLTYSETVRRNGAVGCSRNENLCQYDEFCNEAEFYPYGKCKKIIFKKPVGYSNTKRFQQHGRGDHSGRDNALENTKYDMTYFGSDDSVGNIPSNKHIGDKTFRNEYDSTDRFEDEVQKRLSEDQADLGKNQNDLYENSKYDMTHFGRNDEKRSNIGKNQEKTSSKRHLDRQFTQDQQSGPLPSEEFLQDLERRRSSKHGDGSEDRWPPISIPLPIRDDLNRKLEHKQTRNLRPIETRNSKSTGADSGKLPRSDESLDLEIEIKPLTESDGKYFDEDKSKLSSIPEKPIWNSEVTQKIEHVQTNIVSKSVSKKTKVGVLVGGKLDQAKTDIIQNNSPDPSYDRVKDFFKSQQVSSIIEAPLAEKKEAVKLYNIPHDGNVEVKRSSIPKPSVHPERIRVDLTERLNPDRTSDFLDALQDLLLGNDKNQQDAFTSVATDENKVSFHLLNNTTTNGLKPSHVVQRINKDKSVKDGLKKAVGVTVLSASLESKNREKTQDEDDDHEFMMTTLIVAGCVSGILLVSICIFVILRRTSHRDYPRWVSKQADQGAASDYQSLWRQLRQATWDSPMQTTSVSHSDDGSQNVAPAHKGIPPKYSWSEEPVDTKMDISTGHAVLAYMEDHLKNENRLSKEWEDLSVYEAEPDCTDVGKDPKNSKKNRYSDVLPYDHNRVKLRDTSNATGSDYINASYIVDDDPRNPAYIATQGPLASTVADFWQMVWEQGVVVIVMLTKLADLGLAQCHRYWPQKGHEVYHIYQVNLISEHIWCSDYLVRSFYLKNVQTGETRTVTQFHYLTWPHLGIPFSSKPLLDFRRKVLKCFRSHSCPVVVHCSGGVDRTGTYILIDMVLSKMSRGTKEIDIAATLEHLRDQRPQMVKTKAQFEFALASVAEEVNAILQVLAKH